MKKIIVTGLFFLLSTSCFASINPENQYFFGAGVNINPLGIGNAQFIMVEESGFGYYGSFSTSGSERNDDNYYPKTSRVTVEQVFQDTYKGTVSEHSVFSVGIAYLFSNFLGTIGISHSTTTEYLQYYDALEILGEKGKYFINHKETSGIGLDIGIGYTIENWLIYGKYETSTSLISAGLGYNIVDDLLKKIK